eukprot:g5119.t1
MGICGSSANITNPDDDDDQHVDMDKYLEKEPENGWDKASLEIAIISLSDKLSSSTRRAVAKKNAKDIKGARQILRNEMKPMRNQLKDLRTKLILEDKRAEAWSEDEKREVLKIQPSHLRIAPKITKCSEREFEDLFAVAKGAIGDGMCGDVRTVKCKKSGVVFALKTLSKEKIDGVVLDMLRLEVEILAALDHPNVVHVVDAFETPSKILLILQFGRGGDLFEYIRKQKNKRLPYASARIAIWQIALGLAHCHAQGIVHRDIKLENFIFVDTPEEGKPLPRLQLIDFGLAKQWQAPGTSDSIQVKKMNTIVGTLDTSAPEVRDRNIMYTSKCDMWSLGAVAFKILSGRYPFQDESRERTLEKIKTGKYTFDDARGWKDIPKVGQDFVRKLLKVDPARRMTARNTLQHPFLVGMKKRKVSVASMSTVLSAMRRFSELIPLQRAALLVHAHFLHCGHAEESDGGVSLKDVFLTMDKDHSGDVTRDEFSEMAKRVCKLDDAEFRTIFSAIDQDGSGRIHYTEFLAAGLFARPADVLKYDVDVDGVFRRLDTDKSGTISMQNLKDFFGETCGEKQLKAVLGVDEDKEEKEESATATKSDSTSERRVSIDKQQFRKLMGHVRDVCLSASTPDLPPPAAPGT